MEIVNRSTRMRSICNKLRADGQRIGFIMTMGALHEGHLNLIREARKMADKIIISVLVNPTQFGPNEDFMTYPRDLARDADLAATAGVDYIFAPSVEDIYPSGFSTFVTVEGSGESQCGQSRSSNFRGVTTVTSILLNVVRPHFAFFGQKDWQQTFIIKRMIRDLKIDLEVVISPTLRDADGLALSSRNANLTATERQSALSIYRALQRVQFLVSAGESNANRLIEMMQEIIRDTPLLQLDYACIVDTENLEPVEEIGRRPVVAIVSVLIGRTRLVDNVILSARE